MRIKRTLLPLFFGLSLTVALLLGAGWQAVTASPSGDSQPSALRAPSATTRYVSTDGLCGGHTPCYATVQAAVDAADGGDEILVAAGTYTDTNSYGGGGRRRFTSARR